MKIQINDSQNLKDVVVQYTGTLDALVPIARANGLAVSAIVQKGTDLVIPDSIISALSREQLRVVNAYKTNAKVVATGSYEESEAFEGDFDNDDFDSNDFLI